MRNRGYAYTLEELEAGLNGVAALVHGPDGRVIAALGVFGPAFRLPEDRMDEVGGLTAEAAAEVCRRLGFLPTDKPGV